MLLNIDVYTCKKALISRLMGLLQFPIGYSGIAIKQLISNTRNDEN